MGNNWVTKNSCFCEVLLSTKTVPSIVLGWPYKCFFSVGLLGERRVGELGVTFLRCMSCEWDVGVTV